MKFLEIKFNHLTGEWNVRFIEGGKEKNIALGYNNACVFLKQIFNIHLPNDLEFGRMVEHHKHGKGVFIDACHRSEQETPIMVKVFFKDDNKVIDLCQTELIIQ